MQVFIKRMSTILSIDTIELSDTIERLKQKVHEKNSIPIHQQVFVFEGKVLESQNTLYDYAIADGNIITLVVQNGILPNPSSKTI